MSDKLLDLKVDLVFQKLFGKQKNCEITRHLLSLILGREINDVNLDSNKRMLRNRQNSKTGRLDVRVKFNNGEDCNIELQVAPYPYMAERMLEYWSGMYDNKINCSEGYEVLKPSISILIANYKLEETKYTSRYHTIWNLREKDCHDMILTKNMEMHILEIPKIKEEQILNDELVQWLKFIEDSKNKEVQRIMGENKYLKQAKEELAYLSGDPDFQRMVEARVGMLRDIHSLEYKGRTEGREEGRAEGKTEGETSKAKEIAKKLKDKNMPIDEIIELTGLTKEEIEKL